MQLACRHAGDIAQLRPRRLPVAVGLGLAYVFVRLGGTFGRLSSFIKGTETELLPVIDKVGETVDRVNGQLDKVDSVTDSAVDIADSADTAVRAVSIAITRPVQKISGFAAGLAHGAASLQARRDWRAAVRRGKEAAAQARARSRGGASRGWQRHAV